MKRILIIAFCLGLISSAYADRLLRIPTANVLPVEVVKFEHAFDMSGEGSTMSWLQWGITNNIEIGGVWDTLPRQETITSWNIEYKIIPPITDLIPGISIGMNDIFNKTEYGSTYYLAVTQQFMLEGDNAPSKDFQLHYGLGVKGMNGAFVGFELPFTNNFTFFAEWDTHQLNAGIELLYNPTLKLRGYVLRDSLHAGLSLGFKF